MEQRPAVACRSTAAVLVAGVTRQMSADIIADQWSAQEADRRDPPTRVPVIRFAVRKCPFPAFFNGTSHGRSSLNR
jgi:hypothetical protein